MYNDAQTAPPINNLLQPDIYNRLDADVIERTRVINTQLDQRLHVQQRIISKYRLEAERFHRREKDKVRTELNRISTKLPAVHRIKDFRSKFLYGIRQQNHLNHHQQHNNSSNNNAASPSQSVPELHVRKIRGVPLEKPELPFCERFFIHHLPTKRKYYRAPTPSPPPFAARVVHPGGGSQGDATVPRHVEDSVVVVPGPESDSDGNSNHFVKPLTPSRKLSLSPIRDTSPGLTDRVSALVTDRRDPVTESSMDHAVSDDQDYDTVSNLHVTTDNHSRRHSVNGRQSPRKSRRRESSRLSLPPLRQQNVRLAQSSPQLYHSDA